MSTSDDISGPELAQVAPLSGADLDRWTAALSAHLFAYQLACGVIPRLGWPGADDAAICYQCDFAGCTNPAHMRLGTNATNKAEYFARRPNLASPLADVRGAAGRTRAIAAAIRTGLANDDDADSIEKRIRATQIAGLALTLW